MSQLRTKVLERIVIQMSPNTVVCKYSQVYSAQNKIDMYEAQNKYVYEAYIADLTVL